MRRLLLSTSILFCWLGLSAQKTNIAPLATVTSSNCYWGPCSTLNDLNLGTCGTKQMQIITGLPPSTTIGVDYIEWNWPAPQSFDEIVIHHGSDTTLGQQLLGATMQAWNGSVWVTTGAFSELPSGCANTIGFQRVITNRFRFTLFEVGSPQNFSPTFREIEIYQAVTSPNDAGVSTIESLTASCPASVPVQATINNYGTSKINSVQVNWDVNGVLQVPIMYNTMTLDTIGGSGPNSALVTLGSYSFSASTNYVVRAWTSLPNNNADISNMNDTASVVLRLSAPNGLAVTNVNATSADISWNGFSSNNYRVAYGPTGFNPQTGGVMVPVTGSTTTISGLLVNTAYDVYLVGDCGGSVFSDTAGPVSFRTPCTIIASSPFSESFDSPLWTAPNGIDPCWSANPSPGTNWSWEPTSANPNGPLNDLTGGNYLYANPFASATTDAELITPAIDVSNLNNPALYFFQHRFGSDSTDVADMEIEVSDDFGATWNNEYTITGHLQNSINDPWLMEFVDLAAYMGDTIIIKFIQVNKGCCSNAAIDSVVVREGPTCGSPDGLMITSITDSNAIAAWSDSIGTKWDLFWGPSGFQQGAPSSFTMTTGTNLDTLGGLLPNTLYDYYVRTNCIDSANGVSLLTGPFTFKTDCSPFMAPYADDFDSSPKDTVPFCWRTTNGAAQTSFGVPQSYPNHISFYPRFPATAADTNLFISPNFGDFTAGDKRIQFYAHSNFTQLNDELVIGSMTNPLDLLSFTPIDTVHLTTTYSLYIVNLDVASGYNGTDQYIAFSLGNSGVNRTIYIDNFVYETIPSCNPPFPHTLGVAGISPTTANIYWGSGTDGDETHWEVGFPGFIPGTNMYVAADTVAGVIDTTLVGGLTALTTYDFYIRDSCVMDSYSPWIGPFTFTTACNVTSAPFTENFDGTNWVARNGIDFCWNAEPSAGSSWSWEPRSVQPTSGNGPMADKTGGNFMYCEANTLGSLPAVFTTPAVDVSSLTVPALYFSQHRYSFGGNIADMEVEVSNDFGATWSNVYNVIGDIQTSPSAAWEDEVIQLGAYVGDTIQVRFIQTFKGCCGDVAIDDVQIKEAPTCPDVSGLAAVGISDSVATLQWVGNPSAGSYQVWFGPQGFSQGSATIGGVKLIRTTQSLLVDTLSNGTCYEFIVRGICAPSDTGTWIGPVSFCTSCASLNAPYQETFDVWPSNCWDLNGGGKNWVDFAGRGFDRYALAAFSNSNNFDFHMTSPVINLNAQVAQVEFDWSHKYHSSYPDDQLLVIVNKVGTSIMDTIIDLKGVGNFDDPLAGLTTPGNFLNEKIPLDSAFYANSSIRVLFVGSSDGGSNCYVNNFKVRYPISNDVALIDGRFEKNSKCLSTNDTIVLEVQNILGDIINFVTNPLVANYSTTGPINTSGTITVNTGTLPTGGILRMTATNIDMSQPGIYTLNTYINPNPSNLDGLNDTLLGSTTIQIYDEWEVTPDTVVIITNRTDTVTLEARSGSFGYGQRNFYISEVGHDRSGIGAPSGGWPAWHSIDDYIEITGVPNSDLSGIVLEQWRDSSLSFSGGPTGSYTFLPGSFLSPNGTAIVAMRPATPSPSDFFYDGSGGNTINWSAGTGQGLILRDAGGNIIDAVGYPGITGTYTFPMNASVPASAWSGGNLSSASGTCGIRLTGADVNNYTNWVVTSTAHAQNPNAVNVGATGLSWTLNGAVVDTMQKIVVGPYTSSGVFNYIATFTSPCGVFSDTVTVIVNLPVNISYGESTLAQSLVFFPNPAKDEVKVCFDAEATEMTLRVLDLGGKEVMKQTQDNLNGKVEVMISVGHLADGVYMVEISNGELKATKRLIKQ